MAQSDGDRLLAAMLARDLVKMLHRVRDAGDTKQTDFPLLCLALADAAMCSEALAKAIQAGLAEPDNGTGTLL